MSAGRGTRPRPTGDLRMIPFSWLSRKSGAATGRFGTFSAALAVIFASLVLPLAQPAQPVAAQQALLRGQVVDRATRAPLAGAEIAFEGSASSTLSDAEGRFTLTRATPGIVTVRATLLGYAPALLTDVELQTSRSTFVLIELEPRAIELEGIAVGADAFRVPESAPVSAALLSAAEVRRTPGGQLDISRTLLSLPGVLGGVDNRNDLLVRGGGPGENAYYLDGIRIPRINHFATQGASGGALGLVNVDFIRETEFYTGGFPARYGEALSSVLEIRNRPGSPEGLRGDVTLGASEAALTLDGPIGAEASKGSWLFSVRRSYLQFLFEALDIPIRPDYWDAQTRIELNPTDRDQVRIVGLGAIDEFDLATPAPDADIEDFEIVERVIDNDQRAWTLGASWRRLIDDGLLTLTVSRSWSEFRFADPGADGLPVLSNASTERSLPVRLEGEHRLNTQLDASWGVELGRESIDTDVFQRATPATSFSEDLRYATRLAWWRRAAHAQLTARTADGRGSATLGGRIDDVTALDRGTSLSPRFSLRWRLTPTWSLSGAAGLFHQTPPAVALAVEEDGERVNRALRPIRVRQFVLGTAWQPRADLRIALEGFDKRYSRYPILRDDPRISLANLGADYGFVGAEPLRAAGLGRARGLELSAQKKLTRSLYALGAYTLSVSEFSGEDGVLRPSAWDVRHALDWTGGYRVGDRWEIGTRLRTLSGRAFTPFDPDASAAEYEVTGRAVPDWDRIGEQRTDTYARWDIRVERRFNRSGWNAVLYLDVQNVLDRENSIGFTYTRDPQFADGLRPLGGTGRLPFFGFSIEF